MYWIVDSRKAFLFGLSQAHVALSPTPTLNTVRRLCHTVNVFQIGYFCAVQMPSWCFFFFYNLPLSSAPPTGTTCSSFVFKPLLFPTYILYCSNHLLIFMQNGSLFFCLYQRWVIMSCIYSSNCCQWQSISDSSRTFCLLFLEWESEKNLKAICNFSGLVPQKPLHCCKNAWAKA